MKGWFNTQIKSPPKGEVVEAYDPDNPKKPYLVIFNPSSADVFKGFRYTDLDHEPIVFGAEDRTDDWWRYPKQPVQKEKKQRTKLQQAATMRNHSIRSLKMILSQLKPILIIIGEQEGNYKHAAAHATAITERVTALENIVRFSYQKFKEKQQKELTEKGTIVIESSK